MLNNNIIYTEKDGANVSDLKYMPDMWKLVWKDIFGDN
jgi:hypothetical protein